MIMKAVRAGRGDNEMFALVIVLQGKQNGKRRKKKRRKEKLV